LTSALQAAGVAVTAADREIKASASSSPSTVSARAVGPAESRSALMLSISWIALGWLIGLVVVSAVWALSDAATTRPTPPSSSR